MPKRTPLGIIYVYSISGRENSFVLGSKIILHSGKLFFKMLNFLNTLQKIPGMDIEISLITVVFSYLG